MKTQSSSRKALLWCIAAAGLFQATAWSATLTNRYSFDADATDSVSGKNGTVVNGTVSDGQVMLLNGVNTSGDPNGQYVDLPDNLVTNYSSITIETWLTPTLDDFTGGAVWARIWDFGNSDGAGGIPGFMWMRVGDSSQGLRADVVSAGSGDVVSTPATLINGMENHVVFTLDHARRTAKLYLNGSLVGENDNFTNNPAGIGSITNVWLGRSQFAGDLYMTASINEFRIYDGAINPLEAAANYQFGPDTYPPAYGAITNIQLQVTSPLGIGSGFKAGVLAGATGLTNSEVNISGSAIEIAFSSSDTNILTVDANGVATAMAPGTANLIATVGSSSATQSVQVISIPTTMIHRYSFDADLTDSVGGASGGFLVGNASISDGRVKLDGTAGTFVQLPSYLISTTNLENKAFTVETWATIYPNAGTWCNLFVFGNSVNGGGLNYAFMSPNAASGVARFAVGTLGLEDLADRGGSLAGQTNVHIVCVFNPNPTRHFVGIYINGTLAGTDTSLVSSLATINNAYTFLGQSTFTADPNLPGEISEFRVYDGELDRFQIAASAQAGPDNTNFEVGSFVSINLNAGATPVMWLDEIRQISVAINFSMATNINLLGDANLSLVSDNTNVVTVNAAGQISSHRVGTANVTASYNYVVGATTNTYTAVLPITVAIPPATLVHRYSFNEGSGLVVHDSVGAADGTILAATNTLNATNFAWAPAGQLSINTNASLGAVDTFVNLPPGIVSALESNATFEVWVTVNSSVGWQRVFDFGSIPSSPTNAAAPNVFLTRGAGNTTPRYDWVNGNINANATWGNNVQAHFVVLHDGTDGSAKLYRDGVLIASSSNQNLPLSSINDIYAFLGRSIYSEPISLPGGYFDPYLQGSFNEFRIYRGLLTEAEIQRNFVLGPDQLIKDVPISTASGSGNLTLSWPRYGAHFTMESTAALGSGNGWTAVTNSLADDGTNFQVTVPVTGSAQFFRLKQ